jgi:hypothetical protein
MQRVCDFKVDQLNDTGFVAYHPRNDLPGVLAVICLDYGPGTVYAIFAAPLKMVQIAGHFNFVDYFVTILGRMRRFDQVTIHMRFLSGIIASEKKLSTWRESEFAE